MVYTIEDYKNIVQCYEQCDGDIQRTRHSYNMIYCTLPTSKTVKTALKYCGRSIIEKPASASYWTEPTYTEMSDEMNENISIKSETTADDDEEIEFCFNENSQESKNEIGYSKPVSFLQSNPIVYTTRLDDMIIFKKGFMSLDVNDIVDNIILESKPKFRNLPHRINPVNHIINPFFMLVENINKFNELTCAATRDSLSPALQKSSKVKKVLPAKLHATEIKCSNSACLNYSDKTKKLLRQCKPLKVVLEDCKIKPGDTVIVQPTDNGTRDIVTTFKAEQNRPKIITIPQKARCIVFIKHNTNISELYLISGRVAANACYIRNVPKHKLPPRRIVMKNCCWVAREISINDILGFPKINKLTINLMRTPHDCPPDKCICCCKDKSTTQPTNIPHDKLHKRQPLITDQTPTWFKNIQSVASRKDENSICKALKYTRSKHHNIERLVPPNKSPDNGSKSITDNILVNNVYAKKLEKYYVKDNKNVVVHLENNLSKIDKFKHDNPYSLGACCWYEHDKLFREMHTSNPHSTFNYIRTSHPCPKNVCKCCCNPTNTRSTVKLSAKKFMGTRAMLLSKQVAHTKNYNNKTFQRLKKACQDTKISGQGKDNIIIKKSFDNNSLLEKPTTSGEYTIGIERPPSSSTQSLSDIAIQQSRYEQPMNDLQQPTKKSAELENDQIATEDEGDETLDPTVNSLVNSILHRFRDVRLTITPDGDVSAELNSPIQNLSTAELKILSAILTHAKEQVKALKSSPGMSNTLISLSSNMPSISKVSPATLSPTAGQSSSNALSSKPIKKSTAAVLAGPSNPSLPNTRKNNKSYEVLSQVAVCVASNNTHVDSDPKVKTIERSSAIIYQSYTNITALKSQQYISSCKTYLDSKIDSAVPIIKEVFSLREEANEEPALVTKIPAESIPGPSAIKRKIPETVQIAQSSEENLKRPRQQTETNVLMSTSTSTPGLPRLTVGPRIGSPILKTILDTPGLAPQVPQIVVNGTNVAPAGTSQNNIIIMPLQSVIDSTVTQAQGDNDPSENSSATNDCILGF